MAYGVDPLVEIGGQHNPWFREKNWLGNITVTVAIASICYTDLASCEGFAQVLDFLITSRTLVDITPSASVIS
jgi:hypothetical protein